MRIGADGKGATTTCRRRCTPPARWCNGCSEGDTARVDGDDLKRAVLKLAVAACSCRTIRGQARATKARWCSAACSPAPDGTPDDIRHVVEVVARAAGDDDVRDRVETAAGAVDAKANGHDCAGPDAARRAVGQRWRRHARQVGLGGARPQPARVPGSRTRSRSISPSSMPSDLRYVAKSSQWMRWTGESWQPEDTLAAFDESRKLCRAAGDSHAKTVAAVVTLARSDRRMAATAEQWDAGPM